MNPEHLSLYGLKYDPFVPDVPVEAMRVDPALEFFCWRIEQMIRYGGFGAIDGEPGTGKSVALRVIEARLGARNDLTVGVLTRPQSTVGDFYRELGHIFGVDLTPHNRWAGAKALREIWLAHIDASRDRPVLLVDEAQEMQPAVLSELRLLASSRLDARSLLTVVLAGDSRLAARLRRPELLPIASRIRARLSLAPAEPEALLADLEHLLGHAGCPALMTDALARTLVEHAGGNRRALMNMAHLLLGAAARKGCRRLDEALYFEVFALPIERPATAVGR